VSIRSCVTYGVSTQAKAYMKGVSMEAPLLFDCSMVELCTRRCNVRTMDIFGVYVDGAGPWGGSGIWYDAYCQLRPWGHTCQGELRQVQTHVDDEMTVCQLGEWVIRACVQDEGGYLHYEKLTDEQYQEASDYYHSYLQQWKEENGYA